MSYLYFDESIREAGDFIVGALVITRNEISEEIRNAWLSFGIDPEDQEYKSSGLKVNDAISNKQRNFLRGLLHRTELALTVCQCSARDQLGTYCCALVEQLLSTGMLKSDPHTLFLDQGISVPNSKSAVLATKNVSIRVDQDSKKVGGIQLADHAAHALGGMLLEEMGIVRKTVRAGENSGYDPETRIELGFELWASLRYALLGMNQYIEGLSPPPDDPANPYFRVDGYGLFIPESCTEPLARHSRRRFGVNYLGCIH